jgi:hypothetical protein
MTEIKDVTIKAPDGTIIAEHFDGHYDSGGQGWFLLTGLPQDFPQLQSWQPYTLVVDGAEMRVRTLEVKHTLMITTNHLSVDFKIQK